MPPAGGIARVFKPVPSRWRCLVPPTSEQPHRSAIDPNHCLVQRHNFMKRATPRQYLFHPVTILLVSLVAAVIFGLFVTLFFDGELRRFLLYYFTPIGIPFIAFLFDRAEQYVMVSNTAWTVDLIAVPLALMRAFIYIPLISGHALFLAYCPLTSRSKTARITAILVLVQVAYLKIFVMHDATTLLGGLVVGCLAAVAYRRIERVQENALIESGS